MANFFFVLAIAFIASGLSLSAKGSSKVVVSGAGGRTGQIVFKKLLNQPTISPVGLVRSEKSKKALVKKIGQKYEDKIQIVDVTDANQLDAVFAGADSLVMCTSAVPKIKIRSIIKVILLKLIRKSGRPEFRFGPNGDPMSVDWFGAKNQVDAAARAGMKQFVFLSSMGGTQPENFLNSIGKVEDDPKSGNILLWKRKAERYLIASGVPYTIVHPGGLLDEDGGSREVLFGVDDKFLAQKVRSIPRADVAEVCVQALKQPRSLNRAFDIIAAPTTGVDNHRQDWVAFFESQGDCSYDEPELV